MAIFSFEEFSKKVNKPINKDLNIKENIVPKTIKETKKVNETAFIVGDTYKVKIVADVPKNLVDEYIEKVKDETGKNPLDNFSESEIAEQILIYTIKQNLVIDNLSADFTVGTDNKIKNTDTESDATALSDDMLDDESKTKEPNISNDEGEIEFDDFNEKGKTSSTTIEPEPDGEINFDLEEKDINNTEDFEFEEGDIKNQKDTSSKTVGDMKKKLGYKTPIEEEEESLSSLYKKRGIDTGFYESISDKMFKRRV